MHPKVLAVAAVAFTKYAAFNVDDVEHFLAGLIEGLIQKDDFTKIQGCLKDAQKVDEEMTEAIADFSKGDVQDIIKGVQVIGQLLTELPQDLGDCKDMQGDIDRIEKWAAIFKDPSALINTLIANVVKNFQGILADATDIPTEISADNYDKLGEDVADILVLALGPVPQPQLSTFYWSLDTKEDPETIPYTQW